MRIARLQRRLLQAIAQENPPTSLPAVRTAMERIVEGLQIGKLDNKQAKLLLSALRLLGRNFCDSPELLEQFPNLRHADAEARA
jgi:hypothetical protein